MSHVIVIDDDLECLDAMRGYLESAGFEVQAAGGLEGRTLLEGIRPDCIVLATTLDSGRGTAIQMVRDVREADPGIGIVVVANGDIADVESEIKGLDVWAVVEKPWDLEKLPSKVSRACEFSAMSKAKHDKLSDDIQMQTMMFQRVKRETRRVRTRRAPRD